MQHYTSILPESYFLLFLIISVLFCCAQSTKPGTYTLRQLCATVGHVQFVLPHIYPIVKYEVYSQEPQLTIEPLTG